MQLASSFTLIPVQLFSTCNLGGLTKTSSSPLLSQRKLALTAINKLFALYFAPKNSKTSRVP
jgi:hypothetical protein